MPREGIYNLSKLPTSPVKPTLFLLHARRLKRLIGARDFDLFTPYNVNLSQYSNGDASVIEEDSIIVCYSNLFLPVAAFDGLKLNAAY